MTERPFITFAQQRAAYLALGLDKHLLRDTYRVVIEPGHITVERYSRKDGQFHLRFGSKDELASHDQEQVRATRRSYARKQRRRR